MRIFLHLTICLLMFSQPVFAYKSYTYDSDGNRVYKTIEQKDFARYKNIPRRAYVRTPRTNWEITDSMRENKHTYSYYKKNN